MISHAFSTLPESVRESASAIRIFQDGREDIKETQRVYKPGFVPVNRG